MPTAASSVPLQSHRPNEQYMPNVPIREKLGAVLEFVEPPHDLDIMRMLPLITTESLILMTLLNRAFAAAQRAQKDPSLAGGVVETALQLKEELLRVRETMEKSNRLKKTVLDMMKTLSEETFQSVDALLAGMDPEQVISKLELVGSVQGALRALGLSEKCSIPAPISPRKDIKTRAKTTEKCTITFQTDGLGAASPLTFRESTCQELYSFMEHRPVVLVRAPPYSGKTSLGDVFEAYLHNKGWKVSVISLAGKADTPLDKFLSNSNMPIGKFFNIQEPFALIIDEAQKAYNEPESSFWCTVKAAKGSATRNRIILLASYGKVNAPKGSTPVDFMGCEKSAEFLSFREEEFIEYCHAMNTGNAGLFQLTDPVIRCIAQFTGLHVGLSTLIVFRLFHEFQDKVSDEKSITQNSAVSMHNHYQSSRSIPIILDGVSLSSVQKDSLLATLTELVISPSPVSTFSRTADPAVLGRMVKIGVVYIHDGAYAFSSPLIQNIYKKKLLVRHLEPRVTPPSLRELVHHAIAEFDPKVLADTQSKSSKDGYPLESCYLVELYRTLSCLLPTNVSVSTNVGCGGAAATGYIDLLINTTSLRWGIEVLREGTDAGMREHRKRFISDAYSAFPFTDWVVIDFRCTERTTPIPDHTMVVVFCLETFTSARVFSANGVRELRVAGLRALSPVDYL